MKINTSKGVITVTINKVGISESEGYITRKIVKETDKAYLIEQEIMNRRDGWFTKFKWVAKSICKNRKENTVEVPEWAVSNGVW